MSDNHQGLLYFESHETHDKQDRISRTLIIADEQVRWDEKGSIRDLLLETEMQLLSPNPGQNYEDVNIINHESEASLLRSDLWETTLLRNTNIRMSGCPLLLLWSSWVHGKTWWCEERHWKLFMMEKMFSVFFPLAFRESLIYQQLHWWKWHPTVDLISWSQPVIDCSRQMGLFFLFNNKVIALVDGLLWIYV